VAAGDGQEQSDPGDEQRCDDDEENREADGHPTRDRQRRKEQPAANPLSACSLQLGFARR
jgi:hypothetical protein